MTEKRGRNILIRMLQLVLAAVVVWQLVEIARYTWDLQKSEAAYEAVQKEVHALQKDAAAHVREGASPLSESETANGTGSVLSVLQRRNADAVGYIDIPSAEIAYPIVQGADNEEYLSQSFHGESSVAGSIFLDWENASDFTDRNTIIYGHHMKNGSMFHNLSAWLQLDAADEAPEIEVIGQQGSARYRVYSVYRVPEEEPYRQIRFASDDEFDRFIQMTRTYSEQDFGMDLTEAQRIITLSTCMPNQEEFRIAVHAVRIEEE